MCKKPAYFLLITRLCVIFLALTILSNCTKQVPSDEVIRERLYSAIESKFWERFPSDVQGHALSLMVIKNVLGRKENPDLNVEIQSKGDYKWFKGYWPIKAKVSGIYVFRTYDKVGTLEFNYMVDFNLFDNKPAIIENFKDIVPEKLQKAKM